MNWFKLISVFMVSFGVAFLTGCDKDGDDVSTESVNSSVRPQVDADLPQTVVDPEFPDDEFIILEDNITEPSTVDRNESPAVRPSTGSVEDNDDFHLYSPNQRRCSELASLANRSGVSQLVVSFEGLMSKQVGFVRKNLVRKSRDSVDFGFVSVAYGWTNSSQAATCAQEWKNIYGERSRILLVGHSFGAGIATFKFLEKIPGITVQHAITLDARTGGTDGRYLVSREFNQFSKPSNVVKFTNFWQSRGLRGYGVSGAENIQITGSSHTGLPKTDRVFRFFVQALRENQGSAPARQEEAVNEEVGPGFDTIAD